MKESPSPLMNFSFSLNFYAHYTKEIWYIFWVGVRPHTLVGTLWSLHPRWTIGQLNSQITFLILVRMSGFVPYFREIKVSYHTLHVIKQWNKKYYIMATLYKLLEINFDEIYQHMKFSYWQVSYQIKYHITCTCYYVLIYYYSIHAYAYFIWHNS